MPNLVVPELFIDIETFSDVELKKFGAYRYAESPLFDIMMAGWAIDDDDVQVAIGWEQITLIPGLWHHNTRKIAHNAAFERICFSAMMYGPGRFLGPEAWHDTQAVAAEHGYPQQLGQLARALGGEQKDEAGTLLINYFCKPYRGRRRGPQDDPVKWAQFVEYCRQDVVTLRSVHRALGDFPTEMEREVYLADQRINDRGMRIDVPLAETAVLAASENQIAAIAEVRALTGVENPNSQPQMLGWLQGQGLKLGDLQADTIEDLLTTELSPKHRRVLELRQDLALVAAKKFSTALSSVTDGDRLRGGFRFFGAHTGRWAGRGVQPHNLPRAQLADETATLAAIADLLLDEGAEPEVLKALVRAMFLLDGVVVDYASIEARVIAWLAGEEWALEAFRAGRDIYVETAARMSTPNRQLTRSQGKVAVLALGFQGWVGSLKVMGAEGDDRELAELAGQWRGANPAIVRFWADLEHAFRKGGRAGRIVVERDEDTRRLRLPSGRAITYHKCRWREEMTETGPRIRASFSDPKRFGWRADTYGGRLAENVTQAVARDILAEALVRLDAAGHMVVGHVHDEILVEGARSVETVRQIMIEPPAWADGLPIDGEGFTCSRYRKG